MVTISFTKEEIKELRWIIPMYKETHKDSWTEGEGKLVEGILKKFRFQIERDYKSLSTANAGTELTLSGSPDGSPKPCPNCDGKGYYYRAINKRRTKFTCLVCKGKASDS